MTPSRNASSSALPKAAGVAEVAGGKRDPVRRIPVELLQELEHDRFLSLDPPRIHGVEQVDAESLRRIADQGEADIKVATNSQRARTVSERLLQLPHRNLARRYEHERRQPGQRRVRGE